MVFRWNHGISKWPCSYRCGIIRRFDSVNSSGGFRFRLFNFLRLLFRLGDVSVFSGNGSGFSGDGPVVRLMGDR